jgi:predicted peroxiredoxin
MSEYLLIESRDPFDSNDVTSFWDLAASLAREGHKVTLFLVQNGVFPARPSTRSKALSALTQAGVEILADEFSLSERGIRSDALAAGIAASPIDVVVDQLTAGRKALWH